MLGIIGIIIAALVCCLCWCCCCCFNNHKATRRITPIDPEKGLKRAEYSSDSSSSNEEIEEPDGIVRISTQTTLQIQDEVEIVEMAYSENGTLLWANKDEVFINSPGGEHAEIMMINSGRHKNVKTIHIKNSPCQECSRELIRYYKHRYNKPTILVGRIWHLYDANDDRGLKDMMKEGFSIQVWEELHHKMYPNDPLTQRYINNLYNSL